MVDVARARIVIGANTKSAEEGIKRVTNSFKNLRKFLTAVVAGKMVKDMANFGKELSLMADRTGMSIERLSALRNIFMSAGSGAKGFQQTIERINSGLLGLRRGESNLAAQLAPLGINPFGKDAGQILEEIADAAKAQLSMGRSRESVLDYLTNVIGIDPATAQKLMEGREAFLKEEARLLGKVGKVSEENNANLTELNKSLGELNAAWTNMVANIVGFVAPAITMLADGISYLLKAIGEGDPLAIAMAITGAIGLQAIMKVIMAWLGKSLLGMLGIGGLATATAGAGTVTAGAGATLAGVGLGTVAIAAALVGVIIDTFKSVYDFITTGEASGIIYSIFESFWGLVFDGFQNVWEWLKEKGKGTWEGIKDWYYNKRAEFGSAMSFHNFAEEGAQEEAARKTRLLFTDPSMDVPVIYGEPLISNENYEKPVIPNSGVNIVNHFEGSTFGSDLPETEDAIGEAMTTVLPNAIPVLG